MARTALITGASSGIGLELARIFASDKHNLVLVARSGDKLQQLSEELKKAHDVKAMVIIADLSKAPQQKIFTGNLNWTFD
jgi:short-subunit dehydrogenase